MIYLVLGFAIALAVGLTGIGGGSFTVPALLLIAGLPAFVAETKFSGDAFRLVRWRSPETRMQNYLDQVLARADTDDVARLDHHLKQATLHRCWRRLGVMRCRDWRIDISQGSRPQVRMVA